MRKAEIEYNRQKSRALTSIGTVRNERREIEKVQHSVVTICGMHADAVACRCLEKLRTTVK